MGSRRRHHKPDHIAIQLITMQRSLAPEEPITLTMPLVQARHIKHAKTPRLPIRSLRLYFVLDLRPDPLLIERLVNIV